MLAWCPMDNIGVRFLLGDIALLTAMMCRSPLMIKPLALSLLKGFWFGAVLRQAQHERYFTLKGADKRKSAPTCRNALKGAPNSPGVNPKAWHQAALIAFRQGDYGAACISCGGALQAMSTSQKA